MEASVGDAREFVAETREDAVAKAESFFRVGADQLEIWVVPPTVQVNGLGGNVLLIAAPKGSRPAPREREERRPAAREERRPEPRSEARREPRSDRNDRPERTERPERSERAERPARTEAREAAPERSSERAPERAPERAVERPRERSGRPERTERNDRSEPRGAARPDRAAARPPARRPEPEPEPVEDVEEGELGPVGEFVAGVLERMKLREVAITEAETDDGDIIISLAGKSIVALADREPRLAAALSHLAHRAAETLVDEEAAARVEIKGTRRPQRDDENERGGRDGRRDRGRPERGDSRREPDERDIDEVALERMAREGAEIVRRTGEPELLRPMNSRERWVVHNSLKDERGVRSESEGEGPRKRVRITPA